MVRVFTHFKYLNVSHTTLKLSSVGNDVVSWCKIQFSTGIPEITRSHNLLSRTLIFSLLGSILLQYVIEDIR